LRAISDRKLTAAPSTSRQAGFRQATLLIVEWQQASTLS